VLEEVFTLITYKVGVKYKKIVNDFLKNLAVQFINSSLSEYRDFFVFKVNIKISFTDASLVYDALKYDVQLVTFDE
jgi:predicted nucleic acid-binding protein